MRRAGILIVGLAWACGGASVPATTTPEAPDGAADSRPAEDLPLANAPDAAMACSWSDSRDVATVADPRLNEISGIAASRLHPGVLYAHNDSGEPIARFFALRIDGSTLAEIVVDGAPSRDIEDAALEAHDGREWMWLGDIGDNDARDGGTPRGSIDVLRAEVPALPDTPSTAPIHVATHERFTFTYPDTPHDSEALIFDGPSGDLYVLAKENEGPQRVYRAAAPHPPGSTRVLELVTEILPGRNLADAITAADADASGRFVVRTYRRVYLFAGPATGTPLERWSFAALELPVVREYQGEAATFAADGRGIFTVAEGDGETVHALDERCAP